MPTSTIRRRAVVALAAALVLVLVSTPISSPAGAAPDTRLAAASGPTAAFVMTRVTARADATRVDLVPGSGEARYVAREVLAGRGFNEAVGRTPDVSGSILIDGTGAVLAEHSRITVDLRTLQSDSANRDRYVQRTTLQTDQYPTADLVVTGASGLPVPLPVDGAASFELVGDLTVHGVTRPTTWQVTATFGGDAVTGTATTDVLLTDFGMEPPKAGPVLSIEDGVRLEIDVQATLTPATAGAVPAGS